MFARYRPTHEECVLLFLVPRTLSIVANMANKSINPQTKSQPRLLEEPGILRPSLRGTRNKAGTGQSRVAVHAPNQQARDCAP